MRLELSFTPANSNLPAIKIKQMKIGEFRDRMYNFKITLFVAYNCYF